MGRKGTWSGLGMDASQASLLGDAEKETMLLEMIWLYVSCRLPFGEMGRLS
jgi:hypothetical protein